MSLQIFKQHYTYHFGIFNSNAKIFVNVNDLFLYLSAKKLCSFSEVQGSSSSHNNY